MSEKIVTHCKDCVFARADENGEQNGCGLGRSEVLGISSTQEDFYLLERFCTAHRPTEWVENLRFEDQLMPEIVVLDELYPRMGFFVRLNTDAKNAIVELEKTLKSVACASHRQQGYPPFVVVINDKVEYNEEIWALFARLFEKGETEYSIVQLSHKPEDLHDSVDEAFIHAQNGWIYLTTSGEEVPHDLIDKLHKMINVHMKQIVMVESYNDFDGLMFPAFLFKFLNGNKSKVFQDESVLSGTFIEKMKQAQARTTNKTIYTWEEFNAS